MDCVHHPGVDAPYQCFRCREFICVDCETKVEGRSYCRSCLANIHQRLSQQYAAETRNINYGLAVISALGAAAVTAGIWSQVTVWLFSIQAWPAVLGAAVGWAVVAGTGGKRGEKLQKLAVVAALAGVIIGFFLSSFRSDAYLVLLQERNLDPQGFTPLNGALSTFPAYLSHKVDFLTWFFLLVGLGLAYHLPHERSAPE